MTMQFPHFMMFTANCTGNAQNTMYNNPVKISTAEELAAACRKDHVSTEFRESRRGSDNFIRCYAIQGDCDNDNTENPAAWITPAAVAARLPGVAFYAVKSRNCDKVKHPGEHGEKSARPRWHYYFPFRHPVPDIVLIRNIMARLLEQFPEFDPNGMKPAQFFFGQTKPVAEYYPGEKDIAEFLKDNPKISTDEKADPEETAQDKPRQPAADYEDDFIAINVSDMLRVIPADDYGEWCNIGMALKAAGQPFAVWDSWSRSCPGKYPGEEAALKKWESFSADGKITAGTLVHTAQKYGWKADPRKYTGVHKAKYEAYLYAEEERQKYQAEHREEYAAKLAAVGIDCAGDPYRFQWRMDFDGSIDEIVEIATGEIVYHKTEEERAAARAAGLSLHLANPAAAAPAITDPAAPWEPIKKAAALPAFPLDRLPAWIKDHILSFAATTGVNTDYCAAAVLGTISAVVVGHLDVIFNGNHREPVQIYSSFVGGSGTMKSSIIRHFMEPANNWLRRNNDKTIKANYAVKQQIDDLEKQIAAARKSSKAASQEKVTQLIEQIEQKRQERHNNFPVPWDDVTPESLVNAMRFSRGSANIATAEGNIINVITGRSYTPHGAVQNIDVFLKGADGESIHQFRVTSGEIDIERSDISILIAIQPALLERLCRSADAVGRGLVQRFLIYAPDETRTAIDHTVPVYMNREHMETWTEHIETIAARFMDPDSAAKFMDMEPAADKIIRAFWNYSAGLITERGANDEDSISGWLAKAHGKAMRLSALLALLRDKFAQTITETDAENAVALFKEYYIPHFIGAYEKPDNLSREERFIANWIMRRSNRAGAPDWFSERELWHDMKQRDIFTARTGRAAFQDSLESLYDRNYIRPIRIKTDTGRGRPAKCWQINPEIAKE